MGRRMTCAARRARFALTLEDVILELCAEARPGRTICPTDAAQAFAAARGEGELGWRAHLQACARPRCGSPKPGRLVIYRKGKPVDPHDFRGVYRLGAPTRSSRRSRAGEQFVDLPAGAIGEEADPFVDGEIEQRQAARRSSSAASRAHRPRCDSRRDRRTR